MKKIALVFVLAVFIPSLVLGWLAARSLRDQQVIVERQERLLCQAASEGIVRDLLTRIQQEQTSFGRMVESLLITNEPLRLGYTFDERIRPLFPLSELGFAVALNGEVLSPYPWQSEQAKRFRIENDLFLCSRETVEVVWQSPKGKISLGKLEAPPTKPKAGDDKSVFATKGGPPDQNNSLSGSAQFRQIVGDSQEGTLARLLQDQLNLLFWYRSPRDTNLVFGVQVNIPRLVQQLATAVRLDPSLDQLFAVALRDDTGRVQALSRTGFNAQWKHPFDSTDVGDVLPHWEVSLYLIDPSRLRHVASTAEWTLGLLIVLMISTILTGGWLVVADLRRELKIAQQKTDFVSNVSHELKTPLTSIRMFSEMLAEGRVTEPLKQREFSQVIATEAARLTRLINNVLQFARIDRGEDRYQFVACDMRELTTKTMETYLPHLETTGFKVLMELPEQSVFVNGDRDALAQILLNLISNAEKYSLETKEIRISLRVDGSRARLSVCDRGMGVPKGFENKIFDQFVRAQDSLANGIQGTGLGLTLARRIARAHGGDIVFARRPEGGSCFTFQMKIFPS